MHMHMYMHMKMHMYMHVQMSCSCPHPHPPLWCVLWWSDTWDFSTDQDGAGLVCPVCHSCRLFGAACLQACPNCGVGGANERINAAGGGEYAARPRRSCSLPYICAPKLHTLP